MRLEEAEEEGGVIDHDQAAVRTTTVVAEEVAAAAGAAQVGGNPMGAVHHGGIEKGKPPTLSHSTTFIRSDNTMKRLDIEMRNRLIRRHHVAMRRATKNNRLAERTRRRHEKKNRDDISKAVTSIRAPAVFDIEREESRQTLIDFIGQLRALFFSKNNYSLIRIDFRATQRFVASGTLLFYAELQRLISATNHSIQLRGTHPQNELASQVLHQIGVYDICHHPDHGKPTHRDVVHWRVAHGKSIDAQIYAPTIEAHEGALAEPLLEGVFKGLAEATANAVEHAYEGIREDSLNLNQTTKDWWVFSQVKDGQLFVALCDLGIGIPRTLPIKRAGVFNLLKERLGFYPKDADCIEAAIEDSKTRTGKSERGKGLGNIIDAVSKSKDGTAVVFSNHGCYVINNGKELKHDYKSSILGTLVLWRLSTKYDPRP